MNIWDCLTDRKILDIIIGDVEIVEIGTEKYKMPYLNGSSIFNLAKKYNLELSYDVGPKLSRWEYMKKLVKHCISSNKINDLLKDVVEIKKFRDVITNIESNKIQEVYSKIIEAFLKKINGIIFFDNKVLKYENSEFKIIEKSDITNKIELNSETYKEVITKFCKKIKKEGLTTRYGEVKEIINPGKQGGNGSILFGILNKKEVAIKILFNSNKEKDNRFFNEFINVFMSLQKSEGIVEMYLYDQVKYEGNEIKFIIMKKYNSNLDSDKPEINYSNLIKLTFELLKIMKTIHSKDIVHRDIKPANILLDENNNIILSDFGIAYFDSEKYDYTGHTVVQQYLGNRKFSAPEQSEPNAIPAPTMDIYAFGQILQWFVTGKVHNGNGRIKLKTIIKDNRVEVIDKIIDKCLEFVPNNRFQSAEEILSYLRDNDIVENEKKEKIEEDYYKEQIIYNHNLDYGEEIKVI